MREAYCDGVCVYKWQKKAETAEEGGWLHANQIFSEHVGFCDCAESPCSRKPWIEDLRQMA